MLCTHFSTICSHVEQSFKRLVFYLSLNFAFASFLLSTYISNLCYSIQLWLIEVTHVELNDINGIIVSHHYVLTVGDPCT